MATALKRKTDQELIDIIKAYEREVEDFELMWSTEPGWHEKYAKQNSLHRKIYNSFKILMDRDSKLYLACIKEERIKEDELDSLLGLNDCQYNSTERSHIIRRHKREVLGYK